MRVEVNPRRVSAPAGKPVPVTVTVTNTTAIISGHRIRILGVDPQWARLDQDSLLLFPETSGVATLTIALPTGIPAGARRIGVEVTELTEPNAVTVVEVEVMVPAQPALKLALDPVSSTGGSRTDVAVVVDNTGNSALDVDLHGLDDEGAVSFGFAPPVADLGPGEQAITTAHLRARRPWFGTPKVRPFTVEAGAASAPVIAHGAWVQKPRLSRGTLALIGLLTAATVFAAVIVASFSKVVNQSNADRDLAIQVAQAAHAPAANGNGSISGTVTLLTSGAPVGGVTVDLYQAASPAQPIVSTATGAGGGYTFGGLVPGSYTVLFNGAGFTQLWYPQSLTANGATPVTVSQGQAVSGIDMRLGGLPASVSGQVTGGDPTGALLTLELPAPSGQAQPTVVTTQTLDASGNFSLANIPSPSLYELVVTKQGYAPSVQEVDLGGGQARSGVEIMLHKGDGSISGTVSSSSGPIGGATITASDTTTTVSTVSVTTPGQVGTFVLPNLPTPDTLTLVVSAGGFTSQTLSVSLAAGQQLSGVSVTMTVGIGSLSGIVSTASGPAGGVRVTATNGHVIVTSVTLSVGAVGSYRLAGLPVPGTYTVTYSRPDLASQTREISLALGQPTNVPNVNATLVSNTASIHGTVTQTGGQQVGGVTILLTAGSISYDVTSATVGKLGAFEIDGVAPGTYTISFTRPGGVPTSSILTLTAGQSLAYNPLLNPAASITGRVVQASNPAQPVPGAQVLLYLSTQFPIVVTATTLTDSRGDFTFSNVDAPQSFIVAFAYPRGSAVQETVPIDTTEGAVSPVCGSHATGKPGSAPPTTTATASCNPQTDPVEVSTG